jgi:iron complex outermembrane receptor protein
MTCSRPFGPGGEEIACRGARILATCAILACSSNTVNAQQDSVRPVFLDTLVVSVDRSHTPSARLPHAHTVVDAAALTVGRTTDGLDDALRVVPGVFVSNRYNYGLDQRLAIRGFGARSAFGVRGVKVLLDGIPLGVADGQTQLTTLETGDLGRAEVWRGVASSLYGNASGGVIALSSGLERVDRPAASVRTTGTEGEFWKGAVDAAAPVGGGTADVSGSWTDASGFRQHSAARFGKARARYRTAIGTRTTLTAIGWFADMPEALNPGALTDDEWRTDPSQAAPANVAAGADKAVWQAHGGITVAHTASESVSGELTAYGARRGLANTLTFGSVDLQRWAYGLRAAATASVPGTGNHGRVTAGIDTEWQRDDRENRSLDGARITLDQLERVSSVGPFLQVVGEPSRALSLRAGVRYDNSHFSVDDRLKSDGDATGARTMNAVTWSVGALLRPLAWLQPFANVGTAFETPTTTELVNTPDGGGGLNPDLEAQHTTQVEAGVRGAAWRVAWEVVAFHADVRDALVPFEDPAQPGRRFFRNAGRLTHRGLEVSARTPLTAWVELQAAYSAGDYRYDDFVTPDGDRSGNHVPGVPRHRLFGTITVRPAVPVWITVEADVVSAVPADDGNTAEAPAYGVGHLRAGWDGQLGRMGFTPFVALLNVLDEQYVSSVVVNARGARYFEPAPGRRLLAGLSASF